MSGFGAEKLNKFWLLYAKTLTTEFQTPERCFDEMIIKERNKGEKKMNNKALTEEQERKRRAPGSPYHFNSGEGCFHTPLHIVEVCISDTCETSDYTCPKLTEKRDRECDAIGTQRARMFANSLH